MCSNRRTFIYYGRYSLGKLPEASSGRGLYRREEAEQQKVGRTCSRLLVNRGGYFPFGIHDQQQLGDRRSVLAGSRHCVRSTLRYRQNSRTVRKEKLKFINPLADIIGTSAKGQGAQ